MNMKLAAPLALILTAAFATDAAAQLTYPIGVRVPHVVVNDTDGWMEVSPCPPWVLDANFEPIQFAQFCPAIALLLQPGAVYVGHWDQLDGQHQQVPPGLYYVEGVPVIIDALADTALTPLGPTRVGFARAFELAVPASPNGIHVMAASGSTTVGLPLGCGLHFPLDFDALLLQSIFNTSVFANFIGQLDGLGYSTAPRVAVPNFPALAGIEFDVAFAVLDPFAPCGVATVSAPLHVTIQP